MRLKDKVIIVTGSTTGIGMAIAERCVDEGALVVVHGRNAGRGKELVKRLGSRALLHVDDLTDPDAPQRLVNAAINSYERLDAVVNNAAYVLRSDIRNTNTTLFDQVMAVNVRAPLLMIQAAMRHLELFRGCVLNIGSINGYCGEQNLLAYSISKGALMTLSRNLGDTLHAYHGIRVNHFNVGWVLTDNEYRYKIADGLPPDWPEKVPKQYAPSGKLIRPEEIAEAAVYWISDASRPISGSVIELEQYPIVGRNPPKEV